MDISTVGRILLIMGLGITLLGGLLLLMGRIPVVATFIEATTLRIGNNGFTCITPIGLMIFISIILTILANIIIRLINRP